jgi:teichuronic acid biosynthesis glycosyltransferase TuaG
MSGDLVSIITPAYKAAAYIDATIQSVVDQTYTRWEMLVADDCSPDTTRSRIARWTQQDPRIRLITLERNGGPARARNAALGAASGRWIAFLDSDDLWLPQKLSQQLAFHEQRGGAISMTGFRRFVSDSGKLGRYIGVPARLDYRQALGNTAIPTSSVIIDRSRSGDLHMPEVYYDDWACWLSVLRKGEVAHGLNEDLMRYRVMPGSVSRNKWRSAREVWKQLLGIEGLPLPHAIGPFASYAANAVLKYRRF